MTGTGDEDKPITTNFAGGVKYPKQSTAYMLVYIRVSDWDRFMCDAGKEDISEPIRKRLEVRVQVSCDACAYGGWMVWVGRADREGETTEREAGGASVRGDQVGMREAFC